MKLQFKKTELKKLSSRADLNTQQTKMIAGASTTEDPVRATDGCNTASHCKERRFFAL